MGVATVSWWWARLVLKFKIEQRAVDFLKTLNESAKGLALVDVIRPVPPLSWRSQPARENVHRFPKMSLAQAAGTHF